MRRTLGATVVALLVTGVLTAHADEHDGSAEPSAPPSAGPLGDVWFADPTNPPAPAGAYERATWEAPEPLSTPPEPTPPAGGPEDLPPGIPPVARAPEPALPDADGWSFGDAFPRTSGTGRYASGAYFWSDFLYDDNGAIGMVPPTNESTGAPSFGTYKYPEPEAHRNGADLFRAAVGREGGETVWRVDWNTLVDPNLPIAAFTIDADDDPATGVEAWPAGAGIRSAGIDWVLVVSGNSARAIDLVTGDEHPADVTVDLDARSFVARTSAIPTSGTALVRVASGLADDEGTAFRQLDRDHGALPGQPNVYNVGFRDYEDEPSATNTWYDSTQAQALTAGGDVSAFAASVDWERLADRETEDEPLLPGYTNRWYVSSWAEAWDGLDADGNLRPARQGIADPGQGISVNGPAAYVGRVQPYSLYVPTTYAGEPAPLTWMLHGASSSHNSAQIHPRYTELACERRGSICVGPLGRGPSGGWRGYAELDVWEVWNRVASTFALDPDRTIISGISMGGFGTYKIAMDHPEAFAAAVTIVAHAKRAEAGHDRLTNLRWTPLYARHGTFDQLVPITDELETQAALDELGLRHVFDFQPVEDHVVVALKDGYDDVAAYMAGVGPRETAPARIDYAWDQPTAGDVAAGVIRTGAWWLDGVAVRDAATRARIEARSGGLDAPEITVVTRDEPRLLGSPSPTIRRIMEWELGEVRPTQSKLEATLTNVAALTVDLAHAGLADGPVQVTIVTDGPTTLTFGGLGDRRIRGGGPPRDGAVVELPAGRHRVQIA